MPRSRWFPALLAALLAAAIALPALVGAAPSAPQTAQFSLVPNPKFAACLARFPGDPARTPQALVTVRRGELNDQLTLRLRNLKPNLRFDLFTVQRSPFLASGAPNPGFAGSFGLAWYQSDVQVNGTGSGDVTINTILLDQIFGFDPDVSLAPTNTFHVGFWFNDPADAQPCGFDPTKPTPFNGEHRAGPLAMISLPNATSGLGPLCTNPDSSTPGRCNP